MKTPRRILSVLLSLFILLASVYFIASGIYGVDLRPRAVLYQLLDPPGHEHVGISKRSIVQELSIIHNQLKTAFHLNKPPDVQSLHRMSRLIRHIEPEYGMDTVKNNGSFVNVCAETFMGPTDGFRYYVSKGWIMEDCNNSHPVETVISLAFYFKSCEDRNDVCTCESVIRKILNGVGEYYPTVPVYVAVAGEICKTIIQNCNVSATVTTIPSDSNPSEGKVWNELVDQVKTPYVLIGRDIYHFWNFSRLERQILIADIVPDTKVIGGAYRNASRHWHTGCYQSEMSNYVLEYQEGYYISRNECMFCDHLMGPFVASTQIFKEFPFDELLDNGVTFYDFFLRLKEHGIHVMNCPDVMYYSSPSVADRNSWIPFVKKWSLNDLHVTKDISYSFSCVEADLSCKNLKLLTRFYLMPPCCLLEFKRAVAFLRDFCKNYSIHYEYTAGSVLGAVKMNGLIPWDLDGDALYFTGNHSVFVSAKEHFMENGFTLTDFEDPLCCDEHGHHKKTGYIQYNTPQMYIEMWGVLQVADEVLPPPDLKGTHTLINIHGEWVNGPPNPGLYARNRYGMEILKHAQSWIHVGKKSSWDDYEAGHFKPCPKHNFHACLDRFPTDGSLIFNLP